VRGASASLLCLALALGARAQDLAVAPERIVVPSGDVQLGSQPEALEAALALCRDERRYGAASCVLERFALELSPSRHHVASFAIDRTEVRRVDYLRCVARGLCTPPREVRPRSAPEDPRLPITGVALAAAEAYCRAVGGRLPTELEWARAAQGDDERAFPWGDGADAGRANHGRPPALADDADGFPALAPVGSFPAGASPFGVLDLAGNVWEWTASLPRAEDRALMPSLGAEAWRVLRGGSFLSPLDEVRAAVRHLAATDTAARDLGFRCAHDL
jgi:formylglycine-generating enzyme required for sulfatase activity